MRTLELNNIDEFSSLQRITNFATLIGTYQKGASKVRRPMTDGPTNAQRGWRRHRLSPDSGAV